MLVVRRAPPSADKEKVQREFVRQLKIAGAAVPDFARFEAALAETKGLDCERDDACPAKLATKAQVLYGLVVVLDVTVEGQLVLQGRVVRDDGEVTRGLESVARPRARGEFIESARPAFVQLFSQLQLTALPAQRTVAVRTPTSPPPGPAVVAPPSVEPPPPAPLVVVAPERRTPVGALALLIAGGSIALIGAAVGLVGFAQGSTLRTVDGALVDPDDAPRLRTASLLATTGVLGMGVGGAAAVLGAVLLATTGSPVALVPGPGGVAAVIGGTW